MKRRKKIKIGAFATALLISLTAWAVIGTVKAHTYKTQIDLNNEKAITELCEYLDSIEVSLTKSLYANSDTMLATLSSKLLRDSAGAKESLSMLYSGETELYNTYKFLSQVGEFTNSLNKKAASGEKISEEERLTLKTLSSYAAGLSLKFEHMASLLSADYFTFDEIKEGMLKTEEGSENTVSYLSGISDAEMSFEDFPSLIYDGPYSDNILSKKSELLENSPEISLDKAKKIAAKALGTEKNLLVEDRDTSGKTAAYCFRTDTYSISVTKKGGFVLEIMSMLSAGEEKLSSADAVEKAKKLNVKRYPEPVTNYTYKVASIYIKLGNYEEAIKHLKQALHYNPKAVYIKVELINLYEELGEFDKAFELIVDTLEYAYSKDQFAYLYEHLGMYFEKICKFDIAVAAYFASDYYYNDQVNKNKIQNIISSVGLIKLDNTNDILSLN